MTQMLNGGQEASDPPGVLDATGFVSQLACRRQRRAKKTQLVFILCPPLRRCLPPIDVRSCLPPRPLAFPPHPPIPVRYPPTVVSPQQWVTNKSNFLIKEATSINQHFFWEGRGVGGMRGVVIWGASANNTGRALRGPSGGGQRQTESSGLTRRTERRTSRGGRAFVTQPGNSC